LKKNHKGETALTIAIMNFPIENKEEMLLIIQHFLEHSQIKENVENICNPLKLLLNATMRSNNILVDLTLFKLMITSQFRDEGYIKIVNLLEIRRQYHYLINEIKAISLGSIALFVFKNYVPIENVCGLQPYIQVMLDAGFDMQAGGVSPLTVFILKIELDNSHDVEITDTQPEGEVPEPHPASKFIDFLINHGAHVGQQTLSLRDMNANVQVQREQLYLPDALFAALYTGKFSFIYCVS
jgi:hypothetical protein